MVIIFLNALALSIVAKKLDLRVSATIKFLELVYLAIFSLESIIKILAMQKAFFFDKWNLFDFIIVIGGLCE